MNRATVVYLAMIAALVGGLWAVLAIGGRLTAPSDLRGRWVASGPGGWRELTVQQSGRYFELAFDGGPAFAVTADAGGRTLARGPWHVTVDGDAPSPERTFRVDGPTPGTFTGRRPAPATREGAAREGAAREGATREGATRERRP